MKHTDHKIRQIWLGVAAAAVLIGGLVGSSAIPAPVRAMSADANGNVSGYIWSSTMGWISLNCNQGSATGGAACGGSAAGVPYSVNITPDPGTGYGVFGGYGWGSNVGWVSFQPADVASCGAQAKMDLNSGSSTYGQVTGWARVLSANPDATATTLGGWDGCISLGGATADGHTYGVTYSPSATGANLSGYAWDSLNLGWIGFTNASLNLSTPSVALTVNGLSTLALGSEGGSVNVAWTTSNLSAADCTASNAWSGARSSSGGSESDIISPNGGSSTVTDTYQISCTGTNGATVSSTATVTVAGATSTTPFLSFLVNGSGSVTLDPGVTSATLSWETQNVQSGSCVGQSSGYFTNWNNPISTSAKSSSTADTVYTEVVTGITSNRTYTLHGCVGTDGTSTTAPTSLGDRTVNITIGTTTDTTASGAGTASGALGNTGKPPWEEF